MHEKVRYNFRGLCNTFFSIKSGPNVAHVWQPIVKVQIVNSIFFCNKRATVGGAWFTIRDCFHSTRHTWRCIQNNWLLESKTTETSRGQNFGRKTTRKKWEHITDEYKSACYCCCCCCFLQLPIFFTRYALHIVFLSFVQLYFLFCIFSLSLALCILTCGKHSSCISRGFASLVDRLGWCVWVWLWFVKHYFRCLKWKKTAAAIAKPQAIAVLSVLGRMEVCLLRFTLYFS